MKKLLFATALLCATSVSQAQTYNGPESVEYDAANGRYLVSNSSNGQILAREDGTGTLSTFATGLTAGPHGLEIVGNNVYACSGGRIVGYELATGNQIMNLNLNGTFLNGITSDGVENLFVTDFGARKIYRINVNTEVFNEMANVNSFGTPNGIIYDAPNNRLVYVEWGGGADIMAVSLADSTVTELRQTNLSNIDGVALATNGNFYVSTWGSQSIQSFNNDFTVGPSLVTNGMSSPADLHLNNNNDTLAIPNSGNNTVVFINLADYVGVPDPEPYVNLQLYPNPTQDVLWLDVDIDQNADFTLSIYNLKGEVMETTSYQTLQGKNACYLDLSDYAEGVYILRMENGSQSIAKKIVVLD